MTSVFIGLISQSPQDLWSSFLTSFLLALCDLIPPLPVLPHCFSGPSPHTHHHREFLLRTYVVWLSGLSNTIVSTLDYIILFASLRATLQHFVDSAFCAGSSEVSMQLEQVTKIQPEPLLW